jgi:hypothetical protein
MKFDHWTTVDLKNWLFYCTGLSEYLEQTIKFIAYSLEIHDLSINMFWLHSKKKAGKRVGRDEAWQRGEFGG